MKKLWLKENDIPELTAFSGNIDADSLKPFIHIAQTTDMKRILGIDLYNKIDTDIQAGTAFTGEYLKIFNEFIVDMLVYFSCSKYMGFGGYKTANAGVYKQTIENAAVVDYKEVNVLIGRYTQIAEGVELEFYKYMKTIELTEYPKTKIDESDSVLGWYPV